MRALICLWLLFNGISIDFHSTWTGAHWIERSDSNRIANSAHILRFFSSQFLRPTTSTAKKKNNHCSAVYSGCRNINCVIRVEALKVGGVDGKRRLFAWSKLRIPRSMRQRICFEYWPLIKTIIMRFENDPLRRMKSVRIITLIGLEYVVAHSRVWITLLPRPRAWGSKHIQTLSGSTRNFCANENYRIAHGTPSRQPKFAHITHLFIRFTYFKIKSFASRARAHDKKLFANNFLKCVRAHFVHFPHR